MGWMGHSFSLSLRHTYTERHLRTHMVCVHVSVAACAHVCVLAVTAVEKLWFHPGRPFAFRPLCAPFQFQSAPRWIQATLETAEYIELFCTASEEKKINSSGKALWGFQTGRDKHWSIYTSRRCFTLVLDGCLSRVYLQGESLLLLNFSFKNDMDD